MRYVASWLRRTVGLTAIGIALSVGGSLPANDQAPADEQPPPATDAAAQPKDAKQAKEDDKPPGRVIIPKYRLGASLAPVPAKLNDQLKLNGEGLLIERVAPEGPAAKAGI